MVGSAGKKAPRLALRSLILASPALLALPSVPAFAACDVGSLTVHAWQAQAHAEWRTGTNEPCTVRFPSHGAVGVTNFAIVQPPAHGRAGVVDDETHRGFGYRPADGFVGHDHFRVSATKYNGDFKDTNPVVIDIDVDVGG